MEYTKVQKLELTKAVIAGGQEGINEAVERALPDPRLPGESSMAYLKRFRDKSQSCPVWITGFPCSVGQTIVGLAVLGLALLALHLY